VAVTVLVAKLAQLLGLLILGAQTAVIPMRVVDELCHVKMCSPSLPRHSVHTHACCLFAAPRRPTCILVCCILELQLVCSLGGPWFSRGVRPDLRPPIGQKQGGALTIWARRAGRRLIWNCIVVFGVCPALLGSICRFQVQLAR